MCRIVYYENFSNLKLNSLPGSYEITKYRRGWRAGIKKTNVSQLWGGLSREGEGRESVKLFNVISKIPCWTTLLYKVSNSFFRHHRS